MIKNVTNYTSGELLSEIRKNCKLSQTKFANSIKKSRDWQYTNEKNISNYYVNDLVKLAKKHKFEIIIFDSKNDRKINFKDYKTNEILRFIREWSGETQETFARYVNKKIGWQHYNEQGTLNYYTSDLLNLVKLHNYEIFLDFKNK